VWSGKKAEGGNERKEEERVGRGWWGGEGDVGGEKGGVGGVGGGGGGGRKG